MNYGSYAASSASGADEMRGRSPLGPPPETGESEQISVSGLAINMRSNGGSNRNSKQNADLPSEDPMMHNGLPVAMSQSSGAAVRVTDPTMSNENSSGLNSREQVHNNNSYIRQEDSINTSQKRDMAVSPMDSHAEMDLRQGVQKYDSSVHDGGK